MIVIALRMSAIFAANGAGICDRIPCDRGSFKCQYQLALSISRICLGFPSANIYETRQYILFCPKIFVERWLLRRFLDTTTTEDIRTSQCTGNFWLPCKY